MEQKDFIEVINNKIDNKHVADIYLKQIKNYYDANNYNLKNHNYEVGDDVILKKGTLLHGTYKNIDGLKEIVENGLIASWFIDGRLSKYPSSVGVWNLKNEFKLKDYINFYSGGTLEITMINGNKNTKVIPYDEMSNVMEEVLSEENKFRWMIEQTKEARFLPSLVQDKVQIGIIFSSDNEYINNLLKYDILSENITDEDAKYFVNEQYYERFIIDKKNKNDFFTDRESAILFGVPSNFIEGILVGRNYEKDANILKYIKCILPDCYICNLDGKVIVI